MTAADFRARLLAIERRVRLGQPTPAAADFAELLAAAPAETIRAAEPAARAVVRLFFQPAQRDELNRAIDRRLAECPPPPPVEPVPPAAPPPAADEPPLRLGQVTATLREDLSVLSRRHIFQWSTFYARKVEEVFGRFVEHMTRYPASAAELATVLREEFATHATEIFTKGAVYARGNAVDTQAARVKSLNGLEKFLNLPVESFLQLARTGTDAAVVRRHRHVCSAVLTGVLLGYGRADLPAAGGRPECGWAVLTADPADRWWLATLPLARKDDLRRLTDAMGGPLAAAVAANLAPLAAAVDRLLAEKPDQFVLPLMGEYHGGPARVSIRLSAPRAADTTELTAHCYLDEGRVDRTVLEEAAARGTALIVAPLRPELQTWAESHDPQRLRVANTRPPGAAADAVYRQLMRRMADISPLDQLAPLPFNYVQNFPLNSPYINPLYFVRRPSTARLLETIERVRTGVHLWCSVRKSGKTTAGFDLSSATGETTVVSQTCDSTGKQLGDDIFFRRFELAQEAARRGGQLPPTFFRDAVRAAVPDKKAADRRTVFILDEYETLFGHLRLSENDPALRYRLVQPLLNQMVSFAREHLLVLLGMRPDAHYVLMEQNQLSQHVVQDRFPLFAHPSADGPSEFQELLQKAGLLAAGDLDPGFVDAMYAETGGHPMLAVNLLSEVFEWLIASRRPARGLRLTAADYAAFAAVRLTPVVVAQSGTYEYMREVVQRALADSTRRQEPWYYAAFTLLRHLAREAPDTLALGRDQAADLVRRHRLGTRVSADPDKLLRTAEQANVFVLDAATVRPRIPLLARLAKAVPDEIDA